MSADKLTADLLHHLAENPMILDKLTADAGQARTMADYQQLLNQTGRRVEARAAANQRPMYVEHYGYTMEYWPHSGQIGVRLTPDQAKFQPLDEPLANKLGIPFEKLVSDLKS